MSNKRQRTSRKQQSKPVEALRPQKYVAGVSLRVCKTGTPWRFDRGIVGMMRGLSAADARAEAYAREPLQPAFTPFVVKGILSKQRRPDGSRDFITLHTLHLSNGCESTIPQHINNMASDGTVRFYYESREDAPKLTIEPWIVMCGGYQFTLGTYPSNAPTWRHLFYPESRAAALAFLCVQLHGPLTRDTARMVARMVYDSYEDSEWEVVFEKNTRK